MDTKFTKLPETTETTARGMSHGFEKVKKISIDNGCVKQKRQIPGIW